MSNKLLTKLNSGAATPWYLAGGAPTPIAAYQPKGAASLAASYLRVAGTGGNANLDPAVVGSGVAPTFDASGWVFNGSSQFLNTGIVPVDGMTFAVQFSNGGTTDSRFIFGKVEAAAAGTSVLFQPYINYPPLKAAYANGSATAKSAAPEITSGNIIIAGDKAYRNGADEGVTLNAWSGTATTAIFVGARSFNGAANLYWSGKIQAIAFYSSVLSASQAAAVAAAMAAL